MLRSRVLSVFRFLLPGVLIAGLPVAGFWAAGLPALLTAAALPAQAQTPNQRLILKDGTYQIVRQYKIVGDRVRYLSAERGEWEELPSSLVDWAATEKWAKDHAPGAKESPSEGATPGNAEAAAIDKEEQDERAEQMARTPQVLPGLLLPDQQGIWVLDTYQNQPELVELTQDSGDVNRRTGHNVLRGFLNSSRAAKQTIEMEGAVSKVQLHVDAPVLYVSLSAKDAGAPDPGSAALTVDTHGAGELPAKDSFSSPTSQYDIVRVQSNFRHNYRFIRVAEIGGGPSQTGDIIPTQAEILPGKRWMKLTPREPLSIGDYALVEILSPGEVNLSVWDFRVDPQGPDNQNAIVPLNRKP